MTNWTGSIKGGGTDRLVFGANSSALTTGQVSQMQFTNPSGLPAGTYAAAILSTGEVVPLTVSPSITTQPQSMTNIVGTGGSFNVAASGTAPLSYQWRLNSANLAGATGTSLAFASVQTTNAGSYTVVVTNVAGALTSGVATLTVWAPPAITVQPTNRVAVVGDNLSFTVAATGTPAPAYQWQFYSTNLPAATAATLSLPNVAMGQAGTYYTVITNIAGTTNSANAVLTVYSTAAPTLGGAAYSTNGQFHLSLTGVPSYKYAILASTNLLTDMTNWLALQTNTSPFTFTDTNALSFPYRFYRAQYVP